MSNEKLSNEIVKAVGGKENIISVQHCMTRLRFALKDESKADDEKVKSLEGVLSLIKGGGQYQVVIGTGVHEVYLEVCKLAGIKADNTPATKEKSKSFFGNILGAIIATIGPLIPILIACGLGKCILIVVEKLGIAAADTSMTYYIFNFVFDAGFTFLPVYTAYAAANYFHCNPYIAALLGCAMLHPNWTSIVNPYVPAFLEGKMFGFIPIYGAAYSSSLLPAILVVWVQAKIEGFLMKKIPEIVKGMLVPLLTVLIMVPLTFCLLGPIMSAVSLVLGGALGKVYEKLGWIAVFIMSLIYPWMVATGTHATLALVGVQLLTQTGFDPFSRTLTLVHNFAQAGACLAVAFRTKNAKQKETSLSAATTALLGGITEPAIFGNSLKLKRPMYAVMIGCGVTGLFAGVVGLKAYAFMTPSVLNFPMWIGPDGKNLVYAIICMVMSVAVTFVATLILGWKDPEEEATPSEDK